MILKGGTPGCIAKPGPGIGHGITSAQVSAGGNADSPLLNDFDPSDTDTQLLWCLLDPLVASGTTTVSDDGDYHLEDPADGTHEQPYRILWAPFAGAPGVDESEITTVVGVDQVIGGKRRTQLRRERAMTARQQQADLLGATLRDEEDLEALAMVATLLSIGVIG